MVETSSHASEGAPDGSMTTTAAIGIHDFADSIPLNAALSDTSVFMRIVNAASARRLLLEHIRSVSEHEAVLRASG